MNKSLPKTADANAWTRNMFNHMYAHLSFNAGQLTLYLAFGRRHDMP